MKKYSYFVSFWWRNDEGNEGFSNCRHQTDTPICGPEEIRRLEEEIQQQRGISTSLVSIVFWRMFETPRKEAV